MIFEGIGYIDIGSATVEVHVIVILSYVATVRQRTYYYYYVTVAQL